MVGARLAVAVGAVLLLIGFAAGTWHTSVSVTAAPLVTCDPALDLDRLPFNDVGAGGPATTRGDTSETAWEETLCGDATLPLRLTTWTALAVGALVALAGWIALSERDAHPPRTSSGSRLPT
jgi:hypothetical protein